MARESKTYVSRETPALTESVQLVIARCDDFLFRPTLQLEGNFSGAFTITGLEIATLRSLNASGAVLGPWTDITISLPISASVVIELPVCFAVRVSGAGGDGSTSVRVLLGGIAYTTHPEGVTQGPT